MPTQEAADVLRECRCITALLGDRAQILEKRDGLVVFPLLFGGDEAFHFVPRGILALREFCKVFGTRLNCFGLLTLTLAFLRLCLDPGAVALDLRDLLEHFPRCATRRGFR